MNLLSTFASGDLNGSFLSPWNCPLVSIGDPSLRGSAISLNDRVACPTIEISGPEPVEGSVVLSVRPNIEFVLNG